MAWTDNSPSLFLLDPESPTAALEIVHGKAENRVRAIRECVFLIGADPQCDLILGGEDIPPVHSYLVTDPDGVTLHLAEKTSSVQVNGINTQECKLQDNDTINLLGIQLRLRELSQARTHKQDAPVLDHPLRVFQEPEEEFTTSASRHRPQRHSA